VSELRETWRLLGEGDEDALLDGTLRGCAQLKKSIDIDTNKNSKNKVRQHKRRIVKAET
jgi:hypothetical protein